MKTTDRIYWHESFPQYVKTLSNGSRRLAAQLAHRIAGDVGVRPAQVYMTALGTDRRAM